MPITNFFMCFLFFSCFTASANLQKCKTKEKSVHYFDESNIKEKSKCTSPATTVIKQSKVKGTIAIKQNPNCAGSSGAVRVNGKTFHFDAAELCRRYGLSKKGTIKRGSKALNKAARKVNAKHAKIYYVNKQFRKKFAAHINKAAKKNNLDPAFVHAIVSAESAYNPNATSRSGAMGLMQLMPMTAKRFNVKNAYNPYQNVEAGAKYLRILFNEFGTLQLAAAGYNAGEGSVRKYNRRIPPYKETMAYVPKVMAFYRKYKKNRHLITP